MWKSDTTASANCGKLKKSRKISFKFKLVAVHGSEVWTGKKDKIEMTSAIVSSPLVSVASDETAVASNIVKLKLKKPKSWNWELSTSASSPLIDFPRILLYDNHDKLLADVEEADCIVNGDENSNAAVHMPNGTRRSASCRSFESFKRHANSRHNSKLSSSNTLKSSSSFSTTKSGRVTFNIDDESQQNADSERVSAKNARKCKRSLSTNSSKSHHNVNEFLEDVVSQLQSKGFECKVRRKSNSERPQQSIAKQQTNEPYVPLPSSAQKTPSPPPADLPIFIYSAKGLIRRDFNAKEFDEVRNRQKTLSVPKSMNDECKSQSVERNVAQSSRVHPKSENTNHLHNVRRNHSELQKSKSAVEIPHRLAVKKERRKARRTHSVNNVGFSSSILERLSAFKARSSSTDSQQCFDDGGRHFVQHMELIDRPKYQLRTSAAGTLVVREENTRNRRMRRRPRSCGKITEIDENACPFEQKAKFVRKFLYSGNECQPITGSESNLLDECAKRKFTPKKMPTYSTADKFPSRYEKAIANIDHLITNVIWSHTGSDAVKSFGDEHHLDAVGTYKKVKKMPNQSISHIQYEKGIENGADQNSDKKFHEKSISTLIKSDENYQLPTANHCIAIVHSNDVDDCDAYSVSTRAAEVEPLPVQEYGDAIDVANNNTRVKQKKKQHNRKVSFNHGDNVLEKSQFNGCGSDANAFTSNLKDFKIAQKIQRSASVGSCRVNRVVYTSSSDDDVGASIRRERIAHRRRTKRATKLTSNGSSTRSNGKCMRETCVVTKIELKLSRDNGDDPNWMQLDCYCPLRLPFPSITLPHYSLPLLTRLNIKYVQTISSDSAASFRFRLHLPRLHHKWADLKLSPSLFVVHRCALRRECPFTPSCGEW